MKFHTVPEAVDAYVFERPENPRRPGGPVHLDPCFCEPQDGYTCELHRNPPTYTYHINGNGGHIAIQPGEWYVRYASGRVIVLSAIEFRKKFQPVPAPEGSEPIP